MNELYKKYEHLRRDHYFTYCIGLKKVFNKYNDSGKSKERFEQLSYDQIKSLLSTDYTGIVIFNDPDVINFKNGLPWYFVFQNETDIINRYIKLADSDPDAEFVWKEGIEIFKEDMRIYYNLSVIEVEEIFIDLEKYNHQLIDEKVTTCDYVNLEKYKADYEQKLQLLNGHLGNPLLVKEQIQKDFNVFHNWLNDRKANPYSDYSLYIQTNFKEEIVDPLSYLFVKNKIDKYNYLDELLKKYNNLVSPEITSINESDTLSSIPDPLVSSEVGTKNDVEVNKTQSSNTFHFQSADFDKEIEILYDCCNKVLIDTDITKFRTAFSNTFVKKPLNIKWIFKARKSKYSSFVHVFYFLYKLQSIGRLQSKFKIYSKKNSKPVSTSFYDILPNIFCDPDTLVSLNRNYIRNYAKDIRNISPSNQIIDSIISDFLLKSKNKAVR